MREKEDCVSRVWGWELMSVSYEARKAMILLVHAIKAFICTFNRRYFNFCYICINYNTGKARVPVLQLICYTFNTLEICPTFKLTAQLANIITDIDYDCGRYFNVFITFPNIFTFETIVFISIMGLYSH